MATLSWDWFWYIWEIYLVSSAQDNAVLEFFAGIDFQREERY